MEARCRVTSKNCVQKEYVLAYVWPKTLLCHFNVPDARLLRVLLWLRTKVEVMWLYACVVAEKDEEVCVVTNKHCVAGISRLCTASITIRRSASPEACCTSQYFVLLQLFTQHENETLLILHVGQKWFFRHVDNRLSCKCHSCASIAI